MGGIEADGYTVHVGAGLLAGLPKIVQDVARAHHYAVISDSNVAPLHGRAIADAFGRHGASSLHEMRAGEAFKTRESWTQLTDSLLAAGCTRDTTVIAVGGGVVGDVAGFVAATFMRGVPVIQCPTSLLAMIDASVGSKTGVDTAAGKNLVGAFHPPRAVVADVDVLSTLPDRERRAGLAEAIKHAVVADAAYLESIERMLPRLQATDREATQALVVRSVEIKSAIVRDDPRENGRRKVLNFGHTLGHAIEHASGYALLHGECVAIGMVLEATLAERISLAAHGTAARIRSVLSAAGLPVELPRDLRADAIVAATRTDKKARGGRVEYALPREVGTMVEADGRWAVPVSDDDVLGMLA